MIKWKKFNFIFVSVTAGLLIAGCGKQEKAPKNPDQSSEAAQPGPASMVDKEYVREAPEMNIHSAAKSGDADIVSKFLAEGIDVNLKDDQSMTALHWAAYRGHLEVAQLLVQKGANTNAQDGKMFSPLHRAAFMGFTEIGKLLVDAGTDVNIQGEQGLTPLFIAKKMQRKEFADMLIANGAIETKPQ